MQNMATGFSVLFDNINPKESSISLTKIDDRQYATQNTPVKSPDNDLLFKPVVITEKTEEGILEEAEHEDTSNDFNNRENAGSTNTPERINYLDSEIYKRDHLNQKIEEMTLQVNQLTSNPSLQEKYLVLEKIPESE